MPTPMSISKSFNRSGALDAGGSWSRDSSLSRLLERSNSGYDAFDHPTPTSFSHLAFLSGTGNTFPGSSSYQSDSGQHMTDLEQNFCQGYHCCGLELGDLHRLLEHFEEHHAFSSSPATSVLHQAAAGKDSLNNVLGSPKALQIAEMKRRAAAADGQSHHHQHSKSKPFTSSSLSSSTTAATSAAASPSSAAQAQQAIPSDGSFHMDDVEMDVDAPEPSNSSSSTHPSTAAAPFDLPSTSAFSRGLAAINSSKHGQTAFAHRRSTSPSSTSSADHSVPSTPMVDSDMEESDWDASASTTSLADIESRFDCVTPSMLYPSAAATAGLHHFQSPAGSQRTSPEAEPETDDEDVALAGAAADPEQPDLEDAEDSPRIVMGNDPTIKHLNHKGRTLIAPPPTLPSGRAWVAPAAKPFKCPVPGCDKAYKQQNGLKYHRLHGNCNNRLGGREGEEGGYDGRETLEEKPYGCYVGAACGKRYKNMNGLRYHYQHSGPHGQIGLEMLSKGTHPAPLLPPGKSARGGSSSAASSRASSPAPLSRFGLSLNLSSAPPSPANSAPGTPSTQSANYTGFQLGH